MARRDEASRNLPNDVTVIAWGKNYVIPGSNSRWYSVEKGDRDLRTSDLPRATHVVVRSGNRTISAVSEQGYVDWEDLYQFIEEILETDTPNASAA